VRQPWAALVAAGLLVGCATVQAGPPNPFDRLTDADRSLARTTRARALETGPSGTALDWSGAEPETGGTIAVLATLRRSDGSYCRRFLETVRSNSASDSFEAVFCRTAAGEWSPEIDAGGVVAIQQR
jgi:surface antigen